MGAAPKCRPQMMTKWPPARFWGALAVWWPARSHTRTTPGPYHEGSGHIAGDLGTGSPGRPSGLPRARLEIAPGRPRAHIMGIRGHIARVRRPGALAARPAFRGGRPEIDADPV